MYKSMYAFCLTANVASSSFPINFFCLLLSFHYRLRRFTVLFREFALNGTGRIHGGSLNREQHQGGEQTMTMRRSSLLRRDLPRETLCLKLPPGSRGSPVPCRANSVFFSLHHHHRQEDHNHVCVFEDLACKMSPRTTAHSNPINQLLTSSAVVVGQKDTL